MANVTLLTFHHVMSKRMIIKQPFEKQTSLLGSERFGINKFQKNDFPIFQWSKHVKVYVILKARLHMLKPVALPLCQNARK